MPFFRRSACCALLLLMISLGGASAEDALLARAAASASQLQAMAQSDIYPVLFSASSEMLDLIRSWGEGDYSAPSAAYRITFDADALTSSPLLSAVSSEPLPAELKPLLSKRLITALPAMLNGTAGTLALAASSIMTVQSAFPCEEQMDYALYILLYDSGMPVAVAFYPEEPGAAGMTACFLVSEITTTDFSLSELSDMLSQLSAPVSIESLLP